MNLTRATIHKMSLERGDLVLPAHARVAHTLPPPAAANLNRPDNILQNQLFPDYQGCPAHVPWTNLALTGAQLRQQGTAGA
jgi:hypothetical protein